MCCSIIKDLNLNVFKLVLLCPKLEGKYIVISYCWMFLWKKKKESFSTIYRNGLDSFIFSLKGKLVDARMR